MDTKKMRACALLLPAPGGNVVIECLDEIERLHELVKEAPSYFSPLHDFEGRKLSWLQRAGLAT